jgi:hypothetical protein
VAHEQESPGFGRQRHQFVAGLPCGLGVGVGAREPFHGDLLGDANGIDGQQHRSLAGLDVDRLVPGDMPRRGDQAQSRLQLDIAIERGVVDAGEIP